MMMKITVLTAILVTALIACQTTPSGQESQEPGNDGPGQVEERVDEEPEKRWWGPDVAEEEQAVEVEEEEMDPVRLASLLDDPKIIAIGEQMYAQRCGMCHGLNGEGGIGSGFDDGQWTYGADPIEIYAATWEGIPANGMPSFSSVLSSTEVAATVAYMLHEFDPEEP